MRLIGLATTFPRLTSCLLRTPQQNRGEYHSLSRIHLQQMTKRRDRYKTCATNDTVRYQASLPRRAGASRNRHCVIGIFLKFCHNSADSSRGGTEAALAS